jgi:hypothetical protein
LALNDKFLAANDKTVARMRPIYTFRFLRKTTILMIETVAQDLRSVAERCTRLARDCRRYELSRALQELGIELMAKAGELEKRFGE